MSTQPDEYAYDVFLSHSSKDKPRVREVAERLRDLGLRVWFDEWIIQAGDSIFAKIEDGLEQSRMLLLFMSQHAFGSDWATLEHQTYRFRDPLNRTRRFASVRLDETEPKGSLATFKYFDWRGAVPDVDCQIILQRCRPSATRLVARPAIAESPSFPTNSQPNIIKTPPMDVPDAFQFGKFIIERDSQGTPVELGRGNMGKTYRARHRSLNLAAVVKLINQDSEIARKRIYNEARAAGLIKHPNVAGVLDCSDDTDPQCYIAMEFVRGETLMDRVKRDGPLNVRDALSLLSGIAHALTAIEEHKLVHRDIKPGNIMLEPVRNGVRAKLIDFGIVKALEDDGDFHMSITVQPVLTPLYASPEQWEGLKVDIRSDMYSLGATLWQALTGAPPFVGATTAKLMHAHVYEEPDWSKVDGVGDAVVALLKTLLAKAPDARPIDSAALVAVWEQTMKAVKESMLSEAKAGRAHSKPDVPPVQPPPRRIVSKTGEKPRGSGNYEVSLTDDNAETAKGLPVERSPWDQGRIGSVVELPLGKGLVIPFCYCPPGIFTMGSPRTEEGRFDDEGPVEVRISKGFWMAQTQMTQAQWEAVMGNNPSRFKGAKLPVDQVSWHDAVECIKKLKGMVAMAKGWKLALPSEAQWEYACRAGTQGAYHVDGSKCSDPWGKDPVLDALGWFDDNSGGTTHSVGEKTANAWSLYDMHGNVWEWCRDGMRVYGDAFEVDPEGPLEESSHRVVRGGSWNHYARYCRAASRLELEPGSRRYDLGFRLCAGQVEP